MEERLESRITSGEITTMMPSNQVERVGYVDISEVIEEIDSQDSGEKQYIHTLEFLTDLGVRYYDMISIESESDFRRLDISHINKVLNKENQYMANFKHLYPGQDFIMTNEKQEFKVFHIGTGDLYDEKSVPIDHLISPRITRSSIDILSN